MSEKIEQPSEEKFRAAEEVAVYLYGDGDFVVPNIRNRRLKLYPPQSCATCDFCLGPMVSEDAVFIHACVSKKRLHFLDARPFLQKDPLENLGTACSFHSDKQVPRQDPEKGGEEPD